MMINSFKNPHLKTTNDGSHTLHSAKFDQDYHTIHGAITESKHVFLKQNGLIEALRNREEMNILEIGFGAGLNLLLLMDAFISIESPAKINYHSIEAYPICAEKAANLNYGNFLNHPELMEKLPFIFNDLKCGFNNFQIIPDINLSVFYGPFDEYRPGDLKFDFIFHDAFSPEVNPELWTGGVFKKILQWSKPKALLTTYCAASRARGAMACAGWKVARAEGVLGKREMTVASPSEKPLGHLKRVNEERLGRRYEEGDF